MDQRIVFARTIGKTQLIGGLRQTVCIHKCVKTGKHLIQAVTGGIAVLLGGNHLRGEPQIRFRPGIVQHRIAVDVRNFFIPHTGKPLQNQRVAVNRHRAFVHKPVRDRFRIISRVQSMRGSQRTAENQSKYQDQDKQPRRHRDRYLEFCRLEFH